MVSLSVAGGSASVGVGGINDRRGDGDRERCRPESEGRADKTLGDGGGSSARLIARSVVDPENLGRLSDEDELVGGARNCRLGGGRGESPEHVEGVGLVPEL